MSIDLGIALAIFGLICGGFWRMWGLIKEARDVGEQAQRDLAAHKTHVAESYVTKQGMHEQTEQLLRAMESIGARLDALSSRMDNWFKPGGRTRT